MILYMLMNHSRRKRLYLSLDLPTLLKERYIDTDKLMPKYVPADKIVTLNIPNQVSGLYLIGEMLECLILGSSTFRCFFTITLF